MPFHRPSKQLVGMNVLGRVKLSELRVDLRTQAARLKDGHDALWEDDLGGEGDLLRVVPDHLIPAHGASCRKGA